VVDMVEKIERKPEQNTASDKKPFARFTGRAIVAGLIKSVREKREKRQESVMNLERIVISDSDVGMMVSYKKRYEELEVESRFYNERWGCWFSDGKQLRQKLWDYHLLPIVNKVAAKCGQDILGWTILHIFEGMMEELKKVENGGKPSDAAANIQRIIVGCLPKKPKDLVEKIVTEMEVAILIQHYGNQQQVRSLIAKVKDASGKIALANEEEICSKISEEAHGARSLIGEEADQHTMVSGTMHTIQKLLRESLDEQANAESQGIASDLQSNGT